ncbi:MAG: hypothetical protein R8M45_03645 [Ghiorsea sp.]
MQTYIYTVEDHSDKRGYNRHVTVFSVTNNIPEEVECADCQSNAWIGGRGVAHQLVSRHTGCSIRSNVHKVNDPEISIFELGSTWDEVEK